jgi:hypothetical protein
VEGYRFHVSVHPLPASPEYDPPREIRGVTVRPLRIPPEALQSPLGLSFEEAAERLERLPRMFLEPDGSFVWVVSQVELQAEFPTESQAESPSEWKWQVDGVLYDRDQRLMFVDLKGECPDSAWTALLQALGADQTPLMFQLVREALFLDEPAMRQVGRMPAH